MKILIAAGGSGGHIFPAIALARTLCADPVASTLLFVGSNKILDRRIFEKEGFPYKLLSANKLAYARKAALPGFAIKLFFDLIHAFLIICSYRPDVVVGFGGYISYPVVVAAWIRGIPCVLHEQNVVPGRANEALSRFARRIAITFPETRERLGAAGAKAIVTGNPIRRDAFKDDRPGGIKKFGLDEHKLTILVVGGARARIG